MRTALIAYVGVFSTILLVAIISTITMKSSYAEVISRSLDDSIEYSVKMIQQDRNSLEYNLNKGNKGDIATPSNATPSNARKTKVDWGGTWEMPSESDDVEGKKTRDEEFKQEFVDNLLERIDSRITGLDIDIYGADAEYGLLSVKVTAHFIYPNGVNGEVTSKKTMILDKILK